MNLEQSKQVFDVKNWRCAPEFAKRLGRSVFVKHGPGGGLAGTLQRPTWVVLANVVEPCTQVIDLIEKMEPTHTKPMCNCTQIQFLRRFGLLPTETGWCSVDGIDRRARWLANYYEGHKHWLAVESSDVIKCVEHGYFVVACGQWDSQGNAGHVSTVIGYNTVDDEFVALDGGGTGEKTRRRICLWSNVWRSSMMGSVKFYFYPLWREAL